VKRPKDCPNKCDVVQLRGREIYGILVKVDDRNWAWVNWCIGKGPMICHLFELAKVKINK
jgi:hypothetical protein